MKRYTVLSLLALLCSTMMWADECLYSDLNGKKGEEIRTALYNHIKNHNVLSYPNVWASATDADDRGDGTNNIWDMYSACVFSKWDKCGSGESQAECECYNREHSLPKSWWGGDTSEPMYTDLHHVIPTDRYANSQRSAWPFGEVTNVQWTSSNGSKLGYGTWGSSGNNMTFEPADEYKGDFARIYFYMVTCYKDKDFTQGGKGYKVFISETAELNSTARNLYLKWHRQDPVSDKERNRNNVVEKRQNNRNPFVDEPDLVEYIWGDKKNVTYSCGGQDMEDVTVSEPAATKVLQNGVIYIIREGKKYTIQGTEVR